LALGAVPGALLWRKHRIAGGLLGAVAGFAVWLTGWMAFKGMI
jgi:Na+/proline symporter